MNNTTIIKRLKIWKIVVLFVNNHVYIFWDK